jgi:hypothetical protein
MKDEGHDKLAAKHGEMVDSKARMKQSSSDTRMRESLETIIKSSIYDGIASFQKSSLEVDDGNVISAAAAVMSFKQFWSEEEIHAAQRTTTLTTKLKASGNDVQEFLNTCIALKGKRAYRINLVG